MRTPPPWGDLCFSTLFCVTVFNRFGKLLYILNCMASYEAIDIMMTQMVCLVLLWWMLQACFMSVAAVSTRTDEPTYVNKQQERLIYKKDTLPTLATSSTVETITVPDVVGKNV